MKTETLQEMAKIIAASVTAIALFSAAFIGVNNLALAHASNNAQVVSEQVTTETDSAFLGEHVDNFQEPNLTILESPNQYYHAIPAGIILREDAALIGAHYIWDVFDESIDGMYVEMLYVNWSSQARNYWLGTVAASPAAFDFGSAEHSELFRFVIDASTGLRVDIAPGFPPIAEAPSSRSNDARTTISSDHEQQIMTWQSASHDERLLMAGLSEAQIEAYLQAARDFAKRHFNNSTLDFDTESYEVFMTFCRSSDSGPEFAGIYFSISDDTGREAIIAIQAETFNLRPGSGIRTQHNDLIPGFDYDLSGGADSLG